MRAELPVALKRLLHRQQPPAVTPDQVLAALGQVLEPETNRDLVTLGLVHNVAARDGVVSFTIQLQEAGSPLQVPLERRARRAVSALPGVRDVRVSFDSAAGAQLRDTSRLALSVTHIVAIASSKGGVGKSTMAVNLAVALGQAGHRTGLLDADIHGPNVPQMLGLAGEPPVALGDHLFPPQAHGITAMSMGLLVPAEAPVIWRGPMLHQALRQMLRDVMWGQLDFLVVDLPPGTGDVQLTLVQTLPLAGVVMVTTPQAVALADVLKGAEMFRQLEVPVLGLIENMSDYLCAHCGHRHAIFGEGGTERLAERLGVPVLARVPLDPAVREGGDQGRPFVLGTTPAAAALRDAAAWLVRAMPAQPPRPAPANYAPDPELRIIRSEGR